MQFDLKQLFDDHGEIDTTYRATVHLAEKRFISFFAWHEELFAFDGLIGIKKLVGDSLELYVTNQDFIEDKDRVLELLPMGDPENPDPNKAVVYTLKGRFYILEEQELSPFVFEGGVEEYIGNGLYTDAILLKDGRYAFVNTKGHGLSIIDQEGKLINVIKDGFPSEMIYTVFQDREENLWMGLNNGLARVSFPAPSTFMGKHFGMSANVHEIERLHDQLYAATTLGLFQFNPAQKPGEHGIFESVNDNMTEVWDVLNIDGTLLISSHNGIFAIQNKQFSPISSSGIPSYFFLQSRFHPDLVYISLALGGIGLLKNTSNGWKYLGKLPLDIPAAISYQEAGPDELWITTFAGEFFIARALGMEKVFAETDPLALSEQMKGLSFSIDSISVPKAYLSTDFQCYFIRDKIYFGTNKGLRSYDSLTQSLYFDPDSYQELLNMLGMMREGSQTIEIQGQRANDIVSSMMLHMGSSSGDRRSVDLNQLLSENIQLAYQGYSGQGRKMEIEIEETLDPSLSPIVCQAPQLSRAMLNVMTNAIEAVNVRPQEAGFVPKISISSHAEGTALVIRIRDNGIGIPMDVQDKLFEPFFTTKPTGRGNIGLGLSIAYDIIVRGHQGEIRLKNQETGGTECLIRLPINQSLGQ